MRIYGKILKILRLAAGLSREELASGIRRLTVQGLAKIEGRNQSGVGEMTAKRIARTLAEHLPISYEQVLESITTGNVTESASWAVLEEIEVRLENYERLIGDLNEVRSIAQMAKRIERMWTSQKGVSSVVIQDCM